MKASAKYKIQYSFQQAAYWASFCTAAAFATVFLQHLGCSNSVCGIIFAIGFLGGFIIGPVLADAVDSEKSPVTLWGVLFSLQAVQAAAIITVLLIGRNTPLLLFCYGVFIALNSCGNGFITQVSVDFAAAGEDLSYGTARGVGSLAYMLMSVVLGAAVTRFSGAVIPMFSLFGIAMQTLAALALRKSIKTLSPAAAKSADSGKAKSLPAFISANPRFCTVLAGICLIFFAHNTIHNFLINVVTNVGGSTLTMGNLNAFVAFVEIPVMFLYPRFLKKYNSGHLLAFAAVFFAVKNVSVAFAGSVPALFGIFSLQMLSFAVYTPVIVDFVSDSIPLQDSAKGQSLAYSMVTLSSIFSSVFGGRLYDSVGVASTLRIGGLVGVCGSALCIAAILIKSKKSR